MHIVFTNDINIYARIIMLSDDEKIIAISLVKSGDVDAILLYLNKIKENGGEELNLYEIHIEEKKPTCKACNKSITVEDYKNDIIRTRNMDCAYTDWMIGCCCCGSGPEYHKPEYAQFFCCEKCFSDARSTRKSLDCNTKEYRLMCTTKYFDSAHLFKNIGE